MDRGLGFMNDQTVKRALLLVMRSDERNVRMAGGDASIVAPEKNGSSKGCDVRGRKKRREGMW